MTSQRAMIPSSYGRSFLLALYLCLNKAGSSLPVGEFYEEVTSFRTTERIACTDVTLTLRSMFACGARCTKAERCVGFSWDTGDSACTTCDVMPLGDVTTEDVTLQEFYRKKDVLDSIKRGMAC